MPQSQAQPSEEQAIQDFITWVDRNRINGKLGSSNIDSPFMPIQLLESHLKAPRRLHQILTALFPESHILPIDPDDIWRLGIVRMFAIFILIDKGRLIKTIANRTMLVDKHLPFTSEPLHFPRLADGDTSIWSAFYEKQFQFCPHLLMAGATDIILENDSILPIVEQEFLCPGGSADICRIKLHAKYDDLLSQDQDTGNRPSNTYILKTYNTKDAFVYYTNEKTAFKELARRKHNGESLVAFYGSFIFRNTYNLLLEFADHGNLEEYFNNVSPPTTGEDILRFWEALFEITKALCNIHQLKPAKDVPKGLDILQGWHQDIDPSNILVFSGKSGNPYDVEFKLADLGLSHFRRVADLDGDGTDRDAWGAREYGAPECYRWDNFIETCEIQTKPYVDIWSFGCVCSEAAVWVVLGMAGVEEYRLQRKTETDELGDFRDGAAFHDSEKVLKAVTDMHERLQGQSMLWDHVTRKALSEMVDSMLETTPEARPLATALERTSQRILKTARKSVQSPAVGKSTTVEPGSVVSATKPLPEGSHRPDMPSSLSDPPPQVSELQSNSFEKITQHHRAATISVPNSSQEVTNLDHPYGSKFGAITTSPSPPHTPTEKRPHDWTFVDESLAHHHDTRSHMDQDSPDPGQLDDPYTPPTIKKPGHRGLESSRSQHRRNLDGSNTSQVSGLLGRAADSSPPSNQMHKLQITTHEKTPTAGLLPMSPDRLQGAQELVKPRERPPRLPFDKAEKYMEEHKKASQRFNPFSHKDIPSLPHLEGYLNDLNQRDHVFLIDDSHSMSDSWSDVKALFKVLAWMIKRKDEDGFDLCFTVSSQDKDKNFKDTTPALRHLSNIKPTGWSNINKRLSDVLARYNLRRKPLSLYVFTDGNWQHGSDGVAPIRILVEEINSKKLPKDRVGIQFIQFGKDPEGTKRLNYLDSGLGKAIKAEMIAADPMAEIRHRVWDIVDTEPFPDGDVMKMLLGAVNEWFDDDDNEVIDGRNDNAGIHLNSLT